MATLRHPGAQPPPPRLPWFPGGRSRMDPQRFDTLVKSLSAAGTRRGMLRLLAAVPVAGGLVALLAPEEGAGKDATRHQKGSGGQDAKGRDAKGQVGKDGKAGKTRDTHHITLCRPESKTKTCKRKCGK